MLMLVVVQNAYHITIGTHKFQQDASIVHQLSYKVSVLCVLGLVLHSIVLAFYVLVLVILLIVPYVLIFILLIVQISVLIAQLPSLEKHAYVKITSCFVIFVLNVNLLILL
jgi:hypothetical protein